jgi:hypothetical protein
MGLTHLLDLTQCGLLQPFPNNNHKRITFCTSTITTAIYSSLQLAVWGSWKEKTEKIKNTQQVELG